MQQRLLDANLRQEDGPLTETLGLLTTLGEAWDQIAERVTPREAKSGDWRSGSWAAKPGEGSRVALKA